MAVRDPGTPGRNPFFDHGPDAELADLDHRPEERDEPGDDGFTSGAFGSGAFGSGAFGPDAAFSEGSIPWPGPGVDPIGTLAALVDALQGAQPEATEHLVAAAHELVLAVKTVVDATEAVLAAQRAVPRDAARAEGDEGDDPPHGPFSSDQAPASDAPATEAPRSARTSGVRRIDLA